MKRILRICCILLLATFLLPLTARADVIYEPFDSFYDQHRKECTYVARRYTASGPNGTVTLYQSPIDAAVEKTYENGTVLDVSYSYQADDGVLWACCDNWDDGTTGWMPMEYLELIYDGQSFAEDYGDQFVSVEMTLEGENLDGAQVYFWVYPGSKEYIQVPLGENSRPSFHTAYTDELGNEWAQCGYYHGIKGHWINLNDPTADYGTLFPNVEEETIPAETEPAAIEQVEEIKPTGNGEKTFVILAVTAVVAITAVMLAFLKKKQK